MNDDIRDLLEEVSRMIGTWEQKEPTGSQQFCDGFNLAKNIFIVDLMNLINVCKKNT